MSVYLATDVGNVLARIDFDGFLNVLSKTLNISLKEAMYFLERTQRSHDLGLSKIRDELIDHFKIKSEVLIDEIMEQWRKSLVPDDAMINVMAELINKENVKVAILSNVGEEHVSIIDNMLKYHGIEKSVVKHYSCYVGARKPSKLYYQSFLMENPEFANCVYIDDLQENLNAGEKFGMCPLQIDISKEEKTWANQGYHIKYDYMIREKLRLVSNFKGYLEFSDFNMDRCYDLFDNGELKGITNE